MVLPLTISAADTATVPFPRLETSRFPTGGIPIKSGKLTGVVDGEARAITLVLGLGVGAFGSILPLAVGVVEIDSLGVGLGLRVATAGTGLGAVVIHPVNARAGTKMSHSPNRGRLDTVMSALSRA